MLRVKFAVLVLPLALSMASCGKTDKSTEAIDSLMAHMVSVEGGTFTMGATEEQKTDVAKDERPLHEVTLSDFKIGRYEVTQAQWVAVMGQNPSKEQGDDLPVTNVSWDDCQQFLKRLNEMTGHAFRLPTEAEWEASLLRIFSRYALISSSSSQSFTLALMSSSIADTFRLAPPCLPPFREPIPAAMEE